jgi:CheY-like chemotaxis protein
MSRKRLLIIDDEADIREVASITLETMSDCDVFTADGGVSGVAAAESLLPDAILLDVMMPGLDGPSTLARLRASAATAHIPIIFLTAKVQIADRQRLAQLGACGLIAKPFDPATFADEVAAILADALMEKR